MRLLRFPRLLFSRFWIFPVAFAALPAQARAQGGADTVKVAKPPQDTTKKVDLFGPGSDLHLLFRGRLESRLEQTHNDRCVSSQLFSAASLCAASFQPIFDFKFVVNTGGTVADRVHVNVDYDAAREFDGSNNISVFYQGKPTDWLQRLDVGNVAFDVPTSRFITSGIPQSNYGVQALLRFGDLRVSAIAAQQKGNVVRDRVYTVGAHTQLPVDRPIDDYQVETRRFFFTVDPRRFAGYPNVDILNGPLMRRLAGSLPDSVRPVHVSLYRLLIGGQPPNPNGPQFRIIGDASSRRGQIYEVLREGVDYSIDPSQLWFALSRPLNLNNERLVAAWSVHLNGRDTTLATTGGTPDVQFVASRDQFANLLWDPQVRPGDDAFFREMRSVYRVGGEDVRRETVAITIVTGGTAEQEKPLAGPAQTFLQLFGLAQLSNPTAFDIDNRLWPRPGDPIFAIGGTATTRVIRDQFLVFPSLQPFGRAGLAQPLQNPANDDIYTAPGEYLYSPQHPQTVYSLRLRYESDGGGDGTTLSLPSNQVHPFSERLTLDDGTRLKRGTDYTVDYDVGTVTFLHPDTLFARPRNVTVRYEENPQSQLGLVPTSIFGVASTLPLKYGDLNFIGIAQQQRSTFTRPQLGYESQSSIIAGVNGAFSFDAAPLARALAKLPGATPNATARMRMEGEVATSRPQPGGAQPAYLETFENADATTVSLADPDWYLSSQPALGTGLAARIGGASSLDLSHAATFAWQTNVATRSFPQGVKFTLQQIDTLTKIVGAGLSQPEPVLWLTLYPLSIGGALNAQTQKYQWQIPGAPTGRRWRSIRQPLGTTGRDLSTVSTLQFFVLVDTAPAGRKRNPILVFDLGDVSENTVALGPTALAVQRSGASVDSAYSGRAIYGRDTLQSERDPFSRAFNQEVNDVGLVGDVIPRLPFSAPDSSGVLRNFAMCSHGNARLARLGDTQTNCTVRNLKLDEWDLDGDGVLNFDSSQREQERLLRFVVDLSDPKNYSRIGGCQVSPADSVGLDKQCWVLVKVPFSAPFEVINGGPAIRRVQTLRITMVSGEQMPDNEFTQLPIAQFRLTGAPWLVRNPRALTGAGGEHASVGAVIATSISTQDKDPASGLVYDSPPGAIDESDQLLTGLENQRVVINEHSMRLLATSLGKYERAEAFLRFPEGAKNLQQYKEVRVWARGRGNGWGQSGDLQFFLKLGRDVNNFYMYRTPVNTGQGQAAWLPEVVVSFDKLRALRAQLQTAWLLNRAPTASCTAADSALIAQSALPGAQISRRFAACAEGYMVYTVDPAVTPPNLAAVQELAAGIVRVDSLGTGATRIGPGDTLEVWVDDIRLTNVENTPGYAAQVGFDLASDLGSVHLNLSHRDPHFRQLAETPSNTSNDEIDVSTTVRVDRLLPQSLGLAIPVTVSHYTTASTPLFLSQSDIPAAGIAGLRTPRSDATSVSVAVRRSTPLVGGWLAPLLNNVVVSGAYSGATSRSEFQQGNNSVVTTGVDYVVGGEAATRPMPGWWDRAFESLPHWLTASELVEALRGAQWRAQPAAFRLSSNYTQGDNQQSTFFAPAASTADTARTVTGLTRFWRNATALELRPFDALSARWELSSLRDLRNYGDTTLATATATNERSRFLGLDAGLERERVLATTFSFAPTLRGWFRPRADFTTSYQMQRDPNSQVLQEGDTTGAFRLPRRVYGLQSFNTGAQVGLARLASAWVHDSASAARLDHLFLPVDISYSRTLNSAFDGTPFTPGLGYEFGLTGETGFLRDHGRLATSAGSTAQFSLSSGLRLPFALTLGVRTQRVATRNWLTQSDQSQVVVDGEQLTLPDLSLRGTWRPRALEDLIASISANAGIVVTRQRYAVPASTPLGVSDLRTGLILRYPLGGNIRFSERGGLAMSFNVASTLRTDSLPGSVSDARAQELSADISRAFKLPMDWQLKSDLRTRLAYQQTTASAFVQNGFDVASVHSRLADNGRQAISLNADTDVADDMTFSLQSSRIVTFDNNLNRRLTQIVFSAVLQISFFAGQLK